MSRIVEYTKDIFIGCYEIITDKKGYKRSMFVNQIYFFGALSLSMVLVVSFFLGLVLTLQFVPEEPEELLVLLLLNKALVSNSASQIS